MNAQIVLWLEALMAGSGAVVMLYMGIEGYRANLRRIAAEKRLEADLIASRARLEAELMRRFAGAWRCSTCGAEMKVERVELGTREELS